MSVFAALPPVDSRRIEGFFDRLWPICRSITGHGIRQSMDILAELMPTERLKFATGTSVFDWTVPKEWNVRDAYVVDPNGKRWAEFKVNNLHLLNYSIPFRGRMSFEALREHIYTLPDQPNAIPYLTSYYKERWGFCLAHEDLEQMPVGDYDVVVDTTLEPGRLEVGEAVLVGETDKEIFFSSYLCHPSMANNELSGPLAVAFIYDQLRQLPRHSYTYRFLFTAETLGTIAYLSQRGEHLRKHMVAGYNITCCGDAGPFTYKKSRTGTTLADRAALVRLRGLPHCVDEFDPADGSDERQFCSPGLNLPVGSLMRTMYGRYPEYHTSRDDKSLISFDALAETVGMYCDIVAIIEQNATFLNQNPYCEPQLGKRGLYPSLGSQKEMAGQVKALLWVLNQSDGTRDLLEIAERCNESVALLSQTAMKLVDKGLLAKVK